ncbi:bifunctional folylpolyglutamate synthase/dihydrofolate synthase [Rubrobacter marinus]|uniref:tetrahydrofolate synthase n=1 Tax=Rubrobacter marinus TaxID=2653852 RepID=A0A6G8PX60_9ACTN|nr:cyanophycin synthetase [Rubrobacter marinus]QIN78786.1 bifunctional folylpolyglutamate synthase/dihydrofolate synthase [Rubrobacter marinus]
MRPAAPTAYEAVCEELDRRRRIALGFERIEALISLLGDPHRALRVAQVVGTNGKGTTASALAAALEAAGHPAGAFLSPHVLSYTERVMVGGVPVSEGEFASAMAGVMEVADCHGVPATQFEILTAGALEIFRDRGLRFAVLEAGLGARHDATTAAPAEVVVLTNVGLDHAEYLGGTVEEIAAEKLASVRPGSTLVLGTDDGRVVRLARETCERVGASLVELTDDRVGDSATADLPTHLARNARLGMRAAEVLLGRPLAEEERGLAARGARLPARFEEFEVGGARVVVDGGHNPEGLAATLSAVRARFGGRRLTVVFGALQDKDVVSMLRAVEEQADGLVLTRPRGSGGRAVGPEELVRRYDPRDRAGGSAAVFESPSDALEAAVGRRAAKTGWCW